MATGASASSMVTSNVMTARWRSAKETIRSDTTRTRLPAGVSHSRVRVSVPARKSRTRS